eukprot:SAG11_NODE_8824_length_972_cov_3.357388_1_plen_66_part_00
MEKRPGIAAAGVLQKIPSRILSGYGRTRNHSYSCSDENFSTGSIEIVVFIQITVDLKHNSQYSPG